MAWMATAVSMPMLLEDGKLESSKQVTKALKCVAFTNMQVGSMMSRKRERLERRIKAVTDEIRMLKADLVENMANHDLRRSQMDDIEDDMEQAHALGNEQMELELLEERQILQEEAKREQVLFRNLKKTVRARRRVRKDFLDEKRKVEEAMAVFNVKQNLIQTLLASCTKRSPSNCDTLSSSASESECGSSDHSESSLDLDLEMASSRSALASDRPLSPTREPARSSLRWSATNSDTDSQTSSQATKRGRSVSFSPLPPTQWGGAQDEEELSSGDDGFQRRYYEHKLMVRQYTHEQQMEELSDSEDDADDERDSATGATSGSDEEEEEEEGDGCVDLSSVQSSAASSKVSVEEATRAEYFVDEVPVEVIVVAA
jgi:hypothetical protein